MSKPRRKARKATRKGSTPEQPKPRMVTFPGEEPRPLAEDVGRVDGQHVCELGLSFRTGLIDPAELPAAVAFFPAMELLPGEERPQPGEELEGYPVFCWVTQREAAKLLRLSTRQIQNLEVRGLPNVGQGSTKRYALPHLHMWWTVYGRRGGSEGRIRRLPWEVVRAEYETEAARFRLKVAEGRA